MSDLLLPRHIVVGTVPLTLICLANVIEDPANDLMILIIQL